MFTESQRQSALGVARDAIVARLADRPYGVPAGAALPPACGVFVTLKVQGHLRGCLGTLECRRGLLEEIARCAADAATVDPRFSPLPPEQLPEVSIEISVLGPLERVDPERFADIVVGQHGLVVEYGRQRGLLLPQVARERRWDGTEFLRQTCIKAGLPPDAWRNGADVYRFEAEIFGAAPAGD
jgi:AmmeMemoRadiSam system protein A